MLVLKSDIQLRSGVLSINEYPHGNRTMHRHHCSECGTALWYNFSDNDKYVSIQTGTLDSPDSFAPIAQLWVSSAVAWASPPDNLTAFDQQPELTDLIEMWRKEHP